MRTRSSAPTPRKSRRLAVALSLSTLLLAALAPVARAQEVTYGWSSAYSNTSRTYGFIYPGTNDPPNEVFIENVTFNFGAVNAQYAHVKSVVWYIRVGTSSDHLRLVYTKGYDNFSPPHACEVDWGATMIPGQTYTFTQTCNQNLYWSGGVVQFWSDVTATGSFADYTHMSFYYSGTGGG